MKLFWNKNTYIRHAGEETLLWNKRTAGCVILTDAEVFTNAVSWTPLAFETLLNRIAEAYDTSVAELEADVREFFQMLAADGFLESDEAMGTPLENTAPSPVSFDRDGTVMDENWTPLGSFFEKHHIPCELHLDLTSACTERCVHCYIPDNVNSYLPFELIRKALKEYRELGGLTVHISGGECMLHPDFDDILRLCLELNLNIIVLSNLTLCDEKKVRLLQECDPQFVNVSLYSMNPDQHDAVTTIPGSWEKTMDAILALEKGGVHVRLAAPLLKENQQDFGKLADFAREHHMHLVPDCDIFPQSDHNCSNLDHAVSPAELEKVLRENKMLFDKSYREAVMPSPEEKVCDIGKARICLDSLGNYYPCDGTHGLILGNAKENTVGEVWYGEKFNRLRKLKNRDFASCVTCENRPYCKVCPAHNFNATGDILKHQAQKCAFAAVKKKIYGE